MNKFCIIFFIFVILFAILLITSSKDNFNNVSIPKTIYMCYKNLEDIEKYSKNWKVLNPEWDIELYDDKRCKDFLLKEYSQLYVDIFDYIKHGPIKADFWRVCIINKYGGLYVDADIEPLVSLSEYIDDDDDFVTCISSAWDKSNLEVGFHINQFNPHFILTHKNNEILQNCIDKYIFMYEKGYDPPPLLFAPVSRKWSIVEILKIDKLNNIEKKSQIIYDNNTKYKFILEKWNNIYVNEYNGKIVFNSRYKNYHKNHAFT